jgi:hypothetical protein
MPKNLILLGRIMLYSLISCGCGCSAYSHDSALPKQLLMRWMKPFQEKPYVELTGNASGPSGSGPFCLIMGPEGRYLYRYGSTLWYCDGIMSGSIDYSTLPRTEFSSRDVHRDDVAMAVGMVGGPYVCALAHAAGDERWVSAMFTTDAKYEKRKTAGGMTEIVVTDQGQEWHFCVADDRPSTFEARRVDSPDDQRMKITFVSSPFRYCRDSVGMRM